MFTKKYKRELAVKQHNIEFLQTQLKERDDEARSAKLSLPEGLSAKEAASRIEKLSSRINSLEDENRQLKVTLSDNSQQQQINQINQIYLPYVFPRSSITIVRPAVNTSAHRFSLLRVAGHKKNGQLSLFDPDSSSIVTEDHHKLRPWLYPGCQVRLAKDLPERITAELDQPNQVGIVIQIHNSFVSVLFGDKLFEGLVSEVVPAIPIKGEVVKVTAQFSKNECYSEIKDCYGVVVDTSEHLTGPFGKVVAKYNNCLWEIMTKHLELVFTFGDLVRMNTREIGTVLGTENGVVYISTPFDSHLKAHPDELISLSNEEAVKEVARGDLIQVHRNKNIWNGVAVVDYADSNSVEVIVKAPALTRYAFRRSEFKFLAQARWRLAVPGDRITDNLGNEGTVLAVRVAGYYVQFDGSTEMEVLSDEHITRVIPAVHRCEQPLISRVTIINPKDRFINGDLGEHETGTLRGIDADGLAHVELSDRVICCRMSSLESEDPTDYEPTYSQPRQKRSVSTFADPDPVLSPVPAVNSDDILSPTPPSDEPISISDLQDRFVSVYDQNS